jgi:2-oxoisovalerate dehydrogenase E1 component
MKENFSETNKSDEILTTSSDLIVLYQKMLLIREAELKVLELRRLDEVAGSLHPCVGQEVVPSAIVNLLASQDKVIATYRGHGWAIACGLPLEAFFAEVLGRETGINGGRGGSAYFTAPEYGFVGENSIVGAGLPIANGVALGLNFSGDQGVVVVSFGDGATNEGSSHEAMVFAVARNLPVIFVCENNEWSEMTPISETVPKTSLHVRAGGYGLPAVSVDGSNPIEIIDAASAAIGLARDGGGPSFIEVLVPRILGHYNADAQLYRSEEDKLAHADRDPLRALGELLMENGSLMQTDLDRLHEDAVAVVEVAATAALAAPFPDPATAALHVTGHHKVSDVPPLPSQGKELAYGIAANRALMLAMETDPEVVMFGEDIATAGGTFGVTRNIQKNYGERIFDTPISESAILGAALGASITGMRPVVEIMWSDFLMVALDQLVNQAANVRYISRGKLTAPMVVRMQQGITPGSCAQHSQSLEALIAHIPGLKVGLPSNPDDAFAMLRAAIADPDPVVIIESRALYLEKGIVDVDAPVQEVGGARLRRAGGDAVIVTWGRITSTALEAADQLAQEGIEVAVLDLRWLSPLDEGALFRAVRASSGRVVVLHEANETGGFGGEVVARLAQSIFDDLTGPVQRVGLPDVRVAASPVLQQAVFPSVDRVKRAVHATMRSI